MYEFARIRRSRCVGKLAGIIKGDTCLSGVRDDETDFRLLCERHECPVLRIRVQSARDNVNTLKAIYCLTVQTTLEVHMIQAILTIEPFYHTFFNRLNDSHRTIEVRLSVHVPYDPIHESAEEITFTKLNDFLGSDTLRRSPLV